jgi:hypothetical protein
MSSSPRARRFRLFVGAREIAPWVIILVLAFLGIGIGSVASAYGNKRAATERHRDRLDASVGEGGTRPPSAALPPGARPQQVHAGIYVDRVVAFSIPEASWTVDFHIWFRHPVGSSDPGERFDVVDGKIEARTKEHETTTGDERYVLYRVVAQITKMFDVSRFPCDDHVMTINIELPERQRRELIFIPDDDPSGVSSRAGFNGYVVRETALLEKPHAYRSTRGDPGLLGRESTHSQLRMALWIARPNWGLYLKLFVPLFIAVAVAFMAFGIRPTHVDPRFGLGVGALFAVIANSFIISSLVPHTGIITLADTVNFIGIVTIVLSLVQSAISLYLYDNASNPELSRRFDRISMAVFVVGYVTINLALPLVAQI